jgi:dTDP-4-amino-4,6-dideoxygalactose transaminase
MFYIKVKDLDQRSQLISRLSDSGIQSVFHYVPLHSALAGQKFSRFHGEDRYTTLESERLIRLPMWYGITNDEVDSVISAVVEFFDG